MGLIDAEFFFGVIAAFIFMRDVQIVKEFARPLVILTLVTFFLFANRTTSILFGFAVSLIILLTVSREQCGKLSVPRFLIFLGNASYSIYLVHEPVISLLSRMARRTLLRDFPVAVVVLNVSAAVAIGVVFHLGFERPSVNYARRAIGKRAAFQE